MKLNQVIAVLKGVKNSTRTQLTEAHHKVQKTPLLSGISRTYQPKDEDGDKLPSEKTQVQITALGQLQVASKALTQLFDTTATLDWGNTQARADIVVDGNVLLRDVPVTYLLFLEKQLVDLRTFVEKLPVLDPAETWEFDHNSGLWKTGEVQTSRSKKVPRNHVLAAATDRHPAQVQMYTEDIPVGTWTTVKHSGALPVTYVQDLLEKVEKLQHAVKYAREEANGIEVVPQNVGRNIFAYLLSSES